MDNKLSLPRSAPGLRFYTADTTISQYMPYPRFLLDTTLAHSARLVYILLLSRAGLSRASGWWDEQGRVYVIFTIDELASQCRSGRSTVKKALKDLEDAGFICRRHTDDRRRSFIFIRIPEAEFSPHARSDIKPCPGPISGSPMVEKPSPNNKKNKKYINNLADIKQFRDYSCKEDESIC